jgi:hypothetical protein
MACSLSLVPLPSFYRWLGQEHGRTIPLPEVLNLLYVGSGRKLREQL